MFATVSDTPYDIVLVLHITCAIVGFGAVMLNGIYGQQVKSRRGREGLAIFQANKLVSHIGRYFMYAVFVFGILLVLLSDDAWDFGQTWVWLAMILFLSATAISHGLMDPVLNRMEAVMTKMADGPPPTGGPPPEAAEMEQLGKKVGIIGSVLGITVVLVVILMVTKPGA